MIEFVKITVVADDDLVSVARSLTGLTDNNILISKALKALIERDSAQKSADLGGTMPELKGRRRRRIG